MPKNLQQENNIQSQINFQQKKRIFGANIANNLQPEKLTNLPKQALEDKNDTNSNAIKINNFLLAADENHNFKDFKEPNTCKQSDKNDKFIVFNLNNKNKNKKFFNKNLKTNKNEKSNLSNLNVKDANAENTAFLGWINNNKGKKAKLKAKKANLTNLSLYFNSNNSAFEPIKKEKEEALKIGYYLAESDKENMDAEKNANLNDYCINKFYNKSQSKKCKEGNEYLKPNFKSSDDKNCYVNKKIDSKAASISLVSIINVSNKADNTSANKINANICKSHKSNRFLNSKNSSKMDVISDDNPKMIRISNSIPLSSKEAKLVKCTNINDKNISESNYTNPFSVVNNNPISNNVDINKNSINLKLINQISSRNVSNNIENTRENFNAFKQNLNTNHNEQLNYEKASAQQQINSAFFNYNQNSSLLNNKNKGSYTGFNLNKENSVIYNKNKLISNNSFIIEKSNNSFVNNSTLSNDTNFNNNNNPKPNLIIDNHKIKAENEKIKAIQQQQITLNSNKIDNSLQSQLNMLSSNQSNFTFFQNPHAQDLLNKNSLINHSQLNPALFNVINVNNNNILNNDIKSFMQQPSMNNKYAIPSLINQNPNVNINEHNKTVNLTMNPLVQALNNTDVNYNNNNNFGLLMHLNTMNNPSNNSNFNAMINYNQNQFYNFPKNQINNKFINTNLTECNVNSYHIPLVNCNNNFIIQNTNVSNAIPINIDKKQTAANLKENNKSLFIDTELCNENFEKQIETFQVIKNETNINIPNNINSKDLSIANNQTNQNQNQKQTLLETITYNINKRLLKGQKQFASHNNISNFPSQNEASTQQSHQNAFINSMLLKRIKPNPQILCEYFPELLACLKTEEKKLRYNFQLRRCHPEVSEKMRLILVSWLIEVHRKFKLLDETLYLTVHIIDICLHSKNEDITWNKSNFQLLGISALLLACKYEEIYFPHISDFYCITDRAFSIQQIINCEFLICKMLNYFILTCYPIRFLELYKYIFDLSEAEFFFCKLILEVSLMDSRFLEFDRSIVALTAVFVTGRTMTQRFEAFEQLFYAEIGNRKNEFKECARLVGMHLDNSLDLDYFKIIKERHLNNLRNLEDLKKSVSCNKHNNE